MLNANSLIQVWLFSAGTPHRAGVLDSNLETLELYSQELKNLAMVIIKQMGKALKMKETEMRVLFEDGIQSIRMNYYPPCPEPEKVIGLTPHSDARGLTILLQANEVEWLQVWKDGKWVPVKPLPSAFIVNIGDMLEVIYICC
ncbi:hypothetical protein RJT34_16605 [Clitoria ternatea]|uniref:Fe2OG dioxygenase domain-containing protein n=1 Tax=Clitoria ternatea TaxID=43366 RepID=A0AAN9PDU9_CLITE